MVPVVTGGQVVFPQSSSPLKAIVNRISSASRAKQPEKLYLQTDKPDYFVSDTLWFKAYLLDAIFLRAAEKSGLLYIEIINERDSVVKRQMASLQMGIGWGAIGLNEKDFPVGNYTLQAYTNWMRNFGEQFFFRKSFSISEITNQNWLIGFRMKAEQQEDHLETAASLRFTGIDGRPVASTEMQVKVINGKHVVTNGKLRTDIDGDASFNFTLPEKVLVENTQLRITPLLQDAEKKEFTIPAAAGMEQAIDLQFLPEGGYLVDGLRNHVAFKAIGVNGLGASFSGTVRNSRNQEIAKIHPFHLGMGTFDFMPENGETYTANITIPGGKLKTYTLPPVKPSGVLLQVDNQLADDSVVVSINYSPRQTGQLFYLIGHAYGTACFGAAIKLGSTGKRLPVSKSVFPTGVATFTLLDTLKRLVCERSFFIDHNDNIKISLVMNKAVYGKRDSVGIEIRATDTSGQPVQGTFSLAVTDDNQIKIDSFKCRSLVSDMLLTNYLKGNLEDPGYYFQKPMTPEIWNNLDNLLLAQGWVGYNWDIIFKETAPHFAYAAEQSYSIRGKVTNIFGKPVQGSGMVLMARKPMLVRDTITDAGGMFYFSNLYPSDSAIYFLQSKNKKGRSFNVGIEMEEFKPPPFYPLSRQSIPWYVNTDTQRLEGLYKRRAYQEEKKQLPGAHVLEEVIVRGKKRVRGSKNLNGPYGYNFALNEEDLNQAGKKTLGDLLQERVKGFQVNGIWRPDPFAKPVLTYYVISGKLIHFIIDGVDITSDILTSAEPLKRYTYIKSYLDFFLEQDIKGIEVMESNKYTMKYGQEYMWTTNTDVNAFAFIEVTTFSGNGAYLKHQPGTYLFKPLHFTSDAEFYSPAYRVATDTAFTDTRSTIYWNPNIITNESGKAVVSFYTGQKPAKYTFLIEGTDLNGQFAGERKKIIIE